MKKGEVARLTMTGDYAYGPTGLYAPPSLSPLRILRACEISPRRCVCVRCVALRCVLQPGMGHRTQRHAHVRDGGDLDPVKLAASQRQCLTRARTT
jgi:hypothetical protein